MTLIRETLGFSAPHEAQGATSQPVDPLEKAKSIITQAHELDYGERERIARSFEEQFGGARVMEFLPVLAGRAVKEAVRVRSSGHQSDVPATEIFTAATVSNAESVVQPGRVFLRRLPRIRRRRT